MGFERKIFWTPHSISESEFIIDAFTLAVRDALRDAIVDSHSHYVSSGGIVNDTVRERIMLAYATRLADDRAERVAHKLANVTT